MNIEHYRNFITIVDSGTLSAAADILHIAQPALTAQLKNLEKKFCAPLLHVRRGGHSVELTEAGNVLYNKAKYLCAIEESMQRDIISTMRGAQGKLSISLSPSMSISFIKNFLAGFSQQNPQIEYELYEAGIEEQTDQLLNGIVEIAVINAPLLQTQRFEVLATRKEQLGIIYHQDTAWIDSERIYLDLDGLEDVPICLSRGCSKLFLSICADSKISPHILCVNTTKMAALMWARQKLGVAVVPVGPGEELPPELICRFIQDDRMYLNKSLVIVKGRRLSTVAQKFLRYYNAKA